VRDRLSGRGDYHGQQAWIFSPAQGWQGTESGYESCCAMIILTWILLIEKALCAFITSL
jgi:hypothetical protein